MVAPEFAQNCTELPSLISGAGEGISLINKELDAVHPFVSVKVTV